MIKNTFATLGIFAVLVLTLGLISAVEYNPTSLSQTAEQGTTATMTFTIYNSHTANLTDISMETEDLVSGSDTISVSNINILNLPSEIEQGANSSTVTLEVTIPTSQATGTYEGELDLFGTLTANASRGKLNVTLIVTTTSSTANTLCELEGYDEDGDLEISDFDINVDGEGSDDEWQYLDKIEIVVEIENTDNDDDIDDVEVMIMILDNEINNGGNDVTNDFDIDDEIITSIGKLRDGDEETVTFLIDELPADLDDGTYYMYIMAYEDGNEDEQCVSESNKLDDDYYFKFTVESVDYDESVVARGAELQLQIDTYCDQQNLEIQIPVYNLGSDEEEKVLVNIYNSELGINEYTVIDDLDNGDKEVVTFFIDIPSQLTKEKYNLDISVYFDWDSDEDDDEILSYDEETSATIRLNIIGCKAPVPTITANLGSTAEVGKELIIKATIKNNGQLNDFIIAPTGFETWADLVSVEPGTLSIASGNSQEVTITLLPKQSGAQTFKIETMVDGESYIQPVSVNVKGKPGIFDELGLSDTMLYLIIGITALLILIFLVLIIKIVRKPSKREF
ncbi:putative S-layer protein [archaeon]|nr:putative S-layer protein [archaeon]